MANGANMEGAEDAKRAEAKGAEASRASLPLSEQDATRIVNACYDDVLAYCYRHAPRGYEAPDLAQETFLRFVRAGRYRDEGKPLAYLLSIARNLCIDASRASRNAPLRVPLAPQASAYGRSGGSAGTCAESGDGVIGSRGKTHGITDITDPHDAVADVELACTLKQLDDEAREVIELAFDQGLSSTEIAHVLGISRFSARRRLKRALAQLEEMIAPPDHSIRRNLP